MVKALYNLSFTLPCFRAPGRKKNQSTTALSSYNPHIISLPLRLNPCPFYLLPFLPQPRLLALGCGSVLPIGFGRSVPVLFPGNKTSSWTQSYTCVPSSPPLHPVKQHLHHYSQPRNKNQQKHNKNEQLFSFRSLWSLHPGLQQDALAPEGSAFPSLLSPKGCFFLALTHGPAVSTSEKGLDINV